MSCHDILALVKERADQDRGKIAGLLLEHGKIDAALSHFGWESYASMHFVPQKIRVFTEEDEAFDFSNPAEFAEWLIARSSV